MKKLGQKLWNILIGFLVQIVKTLNIIINKYVEKETATRSSILAWEVPWTEEPGGLQSLGSQRAGHN